ncbi:Uncharacterised protein [Klebsiella pneumoniae]|nr:Uncharacterised protein [Klebsiella pneumoniae]
MGTPHLHLNLRKKPSARQRNTVILLPKYLTVWAFPHIVSISGYGLFNPITANSMPGIY